MNSSLDSDDLCQGTLATLVDSDDLCQGALATLVPPELEDLCQGTLVSEQFLFSN